jgi:tetratricopeptide (TPR) repeat protein
MLLPVPPEPRDIKKWMRSLKESQFGDPTINWDSYVVWAGNKLPKYLWQSWKSNLKPAGFTWQKFMRVLRHRTDVGVMWFKGAMPWEEFVAKVTALIQGPIGRSLSNSEAVPAQKDLAQWQLPPISDWEKFERFCRDLWAEIWNDPEARRNGRSGQPQAGVDVYARIHQGHEWGGVQCKRRGASVDNSLSEAELRKIVEDAKNFRPPLSKFVVAYTGRRDVRLQEVARKITEGHRKNRLFDVDVTSWDDIVEILGSHLSVAGKHLDLRNTNVSASKLEEVGRTTRALLEQHVDQAKNIAEIRSAVIAPPSEALNRAALLAVQVTADVSAVAQEYKAELDQAKELIDNFRPKEALDYLEKLEKRIPANLGGLARYLLLANKAVANAAIGEIHKAGALFIEAYQYNRDAEKAICNKAIGHLLLGERQQAIALAKQVLERNPASSKAYEVLTHCASPAESLDQIIEQIPGPIRLTEEVACAIAHQAREKKDLKASIYWLEIALEKSGKRRKPDLLANLGANLVESLADKFEVVSGIQVGPEDKATLDRAVNLLTEALNAVMHTETMRYRVPWLANRAAAYRLLGEIDSAWTDIESALRIEPDNAGYLKRKAVLLYEKKEFDQAFGTLNGILGDPSVPETALVLAEMLHQRGKNEDAIRTLEDFVAGDILAEHREEATRMLLRIHLGRGDFEGARRISSSMRATDPRRVLNLVEAARVERAAGDLAAASRLLDEARNHASDSTPSRDLIELASELYLVERYTDAWPILENVTDVKLPGPLTQRLLQSYYLSGEFEKALAACKSIPEKPGNAFAAQIEVSILEDMGDLRSAVAVCERYLKLCPDDLPLRVRLATTHFRLGEFGSVDAFLDSNIAVEGLPLDVGLQVAGLYAERGRSQRSLEIAYELRRKYFDDGEAHLRYIGLFFTREKELDPWLEKATVAEDTAVSLKDDAGDLQWYVLEKRADASVARHELSIDSPLAAKLLGKKVSDQVVISDSSFCQTNVTITEIKSKYVHALHQSLSLIPVRFDQTPGLKRMSVQASAGGEGSDEAVRAILDMVTERDKLIREAEKLYMEGRAPIGTLAGLIRKNVIDIWDGLAGSHQRGILCCLGTPDERERAVRLITDHRGVVIDITALLTCERLQILGLAKKVFGELLVGQSTLDLLQEAVSERGKFGSRPFMTISKEGENFYRRDFSPEDIRRDIERLQRLMEWIRNNCTIAPCRALIKLEKERRGQIEKVIGRAFLETLLIAQEHHCPLYSDDLGTRGVGSKEYGIDGFWTQALAIYAVGTGQIREEEYNDLAIKLAVWNFRYTTINSSVLVQSARQSEWVNREPFTSIVNTLSGTHVELRSGVNVASGFIFLLWRQLITDFQRDVLIMAVLDALTQQRKTDEVLRLLEVAVREQFRLLPLAETHVRQVMTAWRSLKL